MEITLLMKLLVFILWTSLAIGQHFLFKHLPKSDKVATWIQWAFVMLFLIITT